MSARIQRNALAVGVATALLAACGGGGGGGGDGGGGLARPAGTQAVGSGALVLAPTTLTGNVTCSNLSIGAQSLDTVTVPAGAACELLGTRLVGSILVGSGATLDARDVRANGNLQAEGAAHVSLSGISSIGGSVQIKQGGSALVSGAEVTGDIQVDAMRGAVVASGNRVNGSLQAVGNRGGITITENRMNGNLQCKENSPAPVAGGNVAASFEDQCAVASGGGGGGSGGGGGTPQPPVPPSGSLSGNVTCDGLRIGADSLDTVIVPANAVCVLEGTRLVGSILVGSGASLTATGVTVNGNLQADGSVQVIVVGASRFGGSVQVKQGGSASIGGAQIGGDLQFDAMRGPLAASGNRIDGNLQAVGNRGGLTVSGNAMKGNLQCKENLPAPTGAGNTAALKEDQCRGL